MDGSGGLIWTRLYKAAHGGDAQVTQSLGAVLKFFGPGAHMITGHNIMYSDRGSSKTAILAFRQRNESPRLDKLTPARFDEVTLGLRWSPAEGPENLDGVAEGSELVELKKKLGDGQLKDSWRTPPTFSEAPVAGLKRDTIVEATRADGSPLALGLKWQIDYDTEFDKLSGVVTSGDVGVTSGNLDIEELREQLVKGTMEFPHTMEFDEVPVNGLQEGTRISAVLHGDLVHFKPTSIDSFFKPADWLLLGVDVGNSLAFREYMNKGNQQDDTHFGFTGDAALVRAGCQWHTLADFRAMKVSDWLK